jgi:hypothetical protein
MAEAPVLVTSLPERSIDLRRAVQVSAAARGISKFRLGAELLQRQLGRQRLTPQEYFLHGAHRAELTDAERDMFIGDELGFRISAELGAKGFRFTGVFLDKVLCDLVLRSLGFGIPRMQAFAGPPRGPLPYLVLQTRAALKRFLDQEAQLPIFGKPFAGSMSLGAVSIVARPEVGRLVLGDGRNVSSARFSEDVFTHYASGYVLQDMLSPDPLIVPLTGPVLATARIVTLRVQNRISVLYGGVKWPGKGAMVDGPASLSSIEASVDIVSGKVIRVQDPGRLGGHALERNPVTDAPLAGQEIPGWEAVKALAVSVHEAFPDQPILGGDFGLAREGPTIVELNSRPGMSFYQKTQARGLWNPDIAPFLTAALAEAGCHRPTRAFPLPWRVA